MVLDLCSSICYLTWPPIAILEHIKHGITGVKGDSGSGAKMPKPHPFKAHDDYVVDDTGFSEEGLPAAEPQGGRGGP